ncbi:hypothetical protein ACI2OX_00415 [Bacillus sp. N9]
MKVDVLERAGWPIVTDTQGKILWIPGLKNLAMIHLRIKNLLLPYTF